VVVDDAGEPVGVFTERDHEGADRFTQLHNVMTKSVHILAPDVDPAAAYEQLEEMRLRVAPVVDSSIADAGDRLLGVMTRKGALRSTIYAPAVDADGKLLVGVAVGINGEPAERAVSLDAAGADVLVIDTAHGHQTRTLRAVEAVRSAVPDAKIVAGNVVTVAGTRQLIEAGADIVKVGVGPGAMCTTRMMTGVGRPQFSAVLECSAEAGRLGRHVWADGGVRFPRDVALALAGYTELFSSLFYTGLAVGALLLLLSPVLKRMMHGVH